MTDNSEDDDDEDQEQDDEELSEEIPIKVEQPKSLYRDLSNKDDDAVVFDDSDEFSLPQVDWTCIDSLSPGGNTDGVVAPVRDEEADVDEDGSVEQETSEQCKVTDSAALNAKYVNRSKDYQLDVSEGDRGISEGLIFNVSGVDRPGADSTLEHEGTESLQESPVLSVSCLSRKRSRTSKDDGEEQVQSKRLHQNDDDVATASGRVAEERLPGALYDDAGSDGAGLLSSYDNSVSECNSPLPSTSCAAETAAISRGSSMPNMFSQDGNASFSQGL